MLNLVIAVAHGLLSQHECGDVATDPQPILVRVTGNERYELGSHRAVDLDLFVSQLFVAIDGRTDLFLAVDQHLRRAGIRPWTIHETGGDDARADLGSIAESFFQVH